MSRELELPDVWNEPERAQALGKERSSLEEVVNTIVELEFGCNDIEELVELAVEEQDQETFDEAESEANALDVVLEKLEFRRMFSGEHDSASCYLDIQSGSGGTEAQDWAEMLMRMYLRWGEAHVTKLKRLKSPMVMLQVLKGVPLNILVNMPMVGYELKQAFIA